MHLKEGEGKRIASSENAKLNKEKKRKKGKANTDKDLLSSKDERSISSDPDEKVIEKDEASEIVEQKILDEMKEEEALNLKKASN